MHRYYTGARIFHQGRLLDGFALGISGGQTQQLLPAAALPENAPVTALTGGILSAGFVETQANGGGGVLVNADTSEAGLAAIMAAHRQYGTAAMLPTFITDSRQRYHQAIADIAAAVARGQAGIIGGHFEGPFLNPAKKGTHNEKYLRTPDAGDFAVFKKHAEHLQHSIISLAPETLPAGTIRELKSLLPQINLAHSMADWRTIETACAEGLTGITHLYNAMPAHTGREPSPLALAASLGLYAGIIADGVHSHPYSLQLAYKSLSAQRLMLVTDSMHTIGAPHIKHFDLMGIQVHVEKDRLINEHGALAGAHITALQSLQNAVRYMRADIESALQMFISTPAAYLRRPDLASITNRQLQDIIYLDSNLELQQLPA